MTTGREMLRRVLRELSYAEPTDRTPATDTAIEVTADALAMLIEKDAQEGFLAALGRVLEEVSA